MRVSKEKKSTIPKKGVGARRSINDESDELVFAVCQRFFEHIQGKSRKGVATAVAEWLAEEYGRADLTREKIYPLVWLGIRRNFLFLQAPVEKELSAKIIDKFNLAQFLTAQDGSVNVVNVSGKEASKQVASVAADKIVELICKIEAEKKREAELKNEDPEKVRVHLGLGAGYAAMEIAKRLSSRTLSQAPKLTLHAISSGGYYTAEPQYDPTTYFTYFIDKQLDVECVGFFSTPIVQNESYKQIMRKPSLRSAFERRDEIDVVVTSLATADDEHGLVRQYLGRLKRNDWIEEDALKTLKSDGWVGDVLFQPYSKTSATQAKTIRTVALFDLADIAEFVKTPNKHVVLIGGPCNACGALKTNALRPLLTEPSLRVWNHLFIDRETASQLVE